MKPSHITLLINRHVPALPKLLLNHHTNVGNVTRKEPSLIPSFVAVIHTRHQNPEIYINRRLALAEKCRPRNQDNRNLGAQPFN